MLSIIVPVYNCEKYLGRCLESIISQTYKELEIILIDDGSTDGSSEICDKYGQKDIRIKAIHKQNGGVSSARNTGLEVITGDYVTFVDSDDIVNCDMYYDLYAIADEKKADIVACNYQYGKWKNQDTENIYEYSGSEAVYKMFTQKREGDGISVAPMDKIYKVALFSNIRFREDLYIAEDIECIARVVLNANKIIKYDKTYYEYCQDGESLTRSGYSLRKSQGIIGAYESLAHVCMKNGNSQLMDMMANKYMGMLLHEYVKIQNGVLENTVAYRKKEWLINLKKKIHDFSGEFKGFTKQLKIKRLIFNISPKFFVWIESKRLGGQL